MLQGGLKWLFTILLEKDKTDEQWYYKLHFRGLNATEIG